MTAENFFEFNAQGIDGTEQDFSQYKGKVVLAVNTASKCGLTPQYEGLEKLHETFADDGLVVLGFPCNQFAGQEPGDEAKITEFCSLNYGVSFPMTAKVDVNGANAHPVWKWMKSAKGGLVGDAIKWNFTKFLIGRDGQVIKRYAPQTAPSKIEDDIRAALAAS